MQYITYTEMYMELTWHGLSINLNSYTTATKIFWLKGLYVKFYTKMADKKAIPLKVLSDLVCICVQKSVKTWLAHF